MRMYWLLSNALRSLIKTTVKIIKKSYRLKGIMVKKGFHVSYRTFCMVLLLILYGTTIRRGMQLGLTNRTKNFSLMYFDI